MMNQNNPMLLFRQLNNQKPENTILSYNFSTGLWQEQNGQPTIERLLHAPENNLGETTITKTREGIDRCENSYM
jgi:hypothetical protein